MNDTPAVPTPRWDAPRCMQPVGPCRLTLGHSGPHEARFTPAEPLDAQPRDTPHLVRDGDRWREHPSEARLAETDAGPRSESRSVASGGWQGGPSGADIDRAIAIIEDSRQTHVNWAEWRRKGNGTDTDHEMIGDLEWHENAIRDYDHVLSVLRSARSTPADPLDVERLVDAELNIRDRLRVRYGDSLAWADSPREHIVDLRAEFARLSRNEEAE